MKLVCSQAELNASLQLVSRAVAGRPTHPVLANVLLTADAGTGRLSLTGFDLSLGIQTSLSASVHSSGAITLPARLFGEIVARMPADSPISLSCDEGGEQVELTSASGSYQMRGMPAEDFPELPLAQAATPIKLDPEVLVKGLRATLFASSSDEAKQLLTGVHLGLDGEGLECAATDGHRLAVLRLQNSADGEADLDVTVPARSLRELERLLSSRGGSSQVWYLALSGGEPQQVTTLPLDVGSFEVSPRGDRLAVSMEVFPDCADLKCTVDRQAALGKQKASGLIYDQLFVRHWDTWKDGRLSQLFTLPIAADGKADKPVTNLGAVQTLSREQTLQLPSEVVEAVMRAPAQTLPAWIELAVGNAGYVVVKISKVVARENNSTAPPRKEEMAQITRWMAAAESVAYYNDLKEKLKAKIMVPEPKP